MAKSKWSYQKIFMDNLPPDTTTEDITDYFSGYGTVAEARVEKKHISNLLQVYGFVVFEDPRSAREALQDPNHVIKDQLVRIKRGHQRIYVLSYAHMIPTQEIYRHFKKIGKIVNVKTHYLTVDGIKRRGSVLNFVTDDILNNLKPSYNIEGAILKVRVPELNDDPIWNDLNSPNFLQ